MCLNSQWNKRAISGHCFVVEKKRWMYGKIKSVFFKHNFYKCIVNMCLSDFSCDREMDLSGNFFA